VIFFLVAAFTCTGCVTQEDLLRVEGHLGAEIAALQDDTSDLKESIKSTRKTQANVDADTIDLRDSLQKLRGNTEELKAKVAALESKNGSKELNDTLDDISNRLAYLESYLGIDKGESRPDTGTEGETAAAESGSLTRSKEESYSKAYSTFKRGEYSLAKKEFRNFLKEFPDTEYSDNAQFWIGQCYYFEGKYEEAIVEYERVIQNYPKGNKVPNAFLRQALSFLKLGDQSSAKLLLQRVIKDYPNTTPARIARKKLVDMK